jgi:hypothetical protein
MCMAVKKKSYEITKHFLSISFWALLLHCELNSSLRILCLSPTYSMFVPYIETCEKSESNWPLQIALKHCMHVKQFNLEVKIQLHEKLNQVQVKSFRVQCHRCTYTKKDWFILKSPSQKNHSVQICFKQAHDFIEHFIHIDWFTPK